MTRPSTSPQRNRGRRLGLVALVTVIVVAVLAVVIDLLVRDDHGTPKSAPEASHSVSASSQAAQPDGPNGCVGGDDPTTAISTAFNEPITERGAVQFSGTVFRWLFDSDTTVQQRTNVGARLANADLLAVAGKDTSGTPAGAHQSFSTKTSYAWVKNFDANKGTATILLTGKFLRHAQQQAFERDAGVVLELTKRDGHWYINRSDRGSYGKGPTAFNGIQRDAQAHGGPLAGGCGE